MFPHTRRLAPDLRVLPLLLTFIRRLVAPQGQAEARRDRARRRPARGRGGDGVPLHSRAPAPHGPLRGPGPPQRGHLLGGRGDGRPLHAERRGGPHHLAGAERGPKPPHAGPRPAARRRSSRRPQPDVTDPILSVAGCLTRPTAEVHPPFTHALRPLHLPCLISALQTQRKTAEPQNRRTRTTKTSHAASNGPAAPGRKTRK
jgi:hypothetical protein